jgi:hypothetical protein
MWNYGLKPPPNSIIHIFPILVQNQQKTITLKLMKILKESDFGI